MKKYSVKFWIIFWTVSVVFLTAFYVALQIKNRGLQNIGGIQKISSLLPISEQYKSLADFADYFLAQDNQEKTLLVLFQNNMEIRPGGGFIGSFGILKVKNGQVVDMQIHDTGNFDARVPQTVPAPQPMQEALRIKSMQLRDSNWSPDFAVNAQAAEKFYQMGQGQEKFDGIIGITTNVLLSFLKATGPVEIPGYPGTYGDENAVLALEYQVEKAFEEQGITRGDRKDVMNDLGRVIMGKVFELSILQKVELAKIIFEDLNRKDIQLYFKNEKLQKQTQQAGWAGAVDQGWKQDFLMTVDANLGAWKSDLVVKRSIDYTVDLSGDVPQAILKITYKHTATKRDFMTKDYNSFLRVYVPGGSWLKNEKDLAGPVFGTELGKKYFGMMVYVPLGQTKTFEIKYALPKEIAKDYNLKIQKQAGLNDTPVTVHVKDIKGESKDYNYTMNKDIVLYE